MKMKAIKLKHALKLLQYREHWAGEKDNWVQNVARYSKCQGDQIKE